MICAKNIYLSSNPPQMSRVDGLKFVELSLPVEEYWKIEELTKEGQYLASSGNEMYSLKELHKKILKSCAPYAVYETDRTWLHETSSN